MDPGLVIWNEFWLETVMVICLDSQMEFWFNVQQKDVSQFTRQVRGRVTCGLGGLVGLVDDRLLRGVETKVIGSFLPRCPH